MYGPTGLKHASDHQLNSLLIDMRSWRAALPLPLQFSGPTTSTYQAGILHVYYNALLFLFFRVFMRISYSLPPHLQFSLDIVTWTELVDDSRAAIEWLDCNDHALDTMFLVSYATTSVALVQVSRSHGERSLSMLTLTYLLRPSHSTTRGRGGRIRGRSSR